MIKLIATDLDGTLFYPKDRIFGMPQSNATFIKNYLKKGKRANFKKIKSHIYYYIF